MKALFRVVMLLFFSCSSTEKQKETQVKHISSDEKKEERAEVEMRWVEYKKVPPNNVHDTVPYPNTFFTVKNNLFIYYRNQKLYTRDSIYLDKEYDYPVYKFKKNSYDILYFEDEANKCGVLKRDNFEGEYEYFRQEEQ